MLKPNFLMKSVANINSRFLQANGIKGLVVDVDNTLAKHDCPTPEPFAVEWINTMKENGFQIVIISNNAKERVQPFSDALGVPFVYDAKKPLGKGYKQALKLMGLKKNQVAMVGDQVFTDTLGGNMAGLTTILVNPIDTGTDIAQIKFKRTLENLIVKRVK